MKDINIYLNLNLNRNTVHTIILLLCYVYIHAMLQTKNKHLDGFCYNKLWNLLEVEKLKRCYNEYCVCGVSFSFSWFWEWERKANKGDTQRFADGSRLPTPHHTHIPSWPPMLLISEHVIYVWFPSTNVGYYNYKRKKLLDLHTYATS